MSFFKEASKTYTETEEVKPLAADDDDAEKKKPIVTRRTVQVPDQTQVFKGPLHTAYAKAVLKSNKDGGKAAVAEYEKTEFAKNSQSAGRAMKQFFKTGLPVQWAAPDGAVTCRRKGDCKEVTFVVTRNGRISTITSISDGKEDFELMAPATDVLSYAVYGDLYKAGVHSPSGVLQYLELVKFTNRLPFDLSIVPATVTHEGGVRRVNAKATSSTLVAFEEPVGKSAARAVELPTPSARHYAEGETKKAASEPAGNIGARMPHGSRVSGPILSGHGHGHCPTVLYCASEAQIRCSVSAEALRHAREAVAARAPPTGTKGDLIEVKLRETIAGVAPDLDAVVFAEYAHKIFDCKHGDPLVNRLKQASVDRGSDDVPVVIRVSKALLLSAFDHAIANYATSELLSRGDALGVLVTPLMENGKRTLAQQQKQDSLLGARQAVYDPVGSITLEFKAKLLLHDIVRATQVTEEEKPEESGGESGDDEDTAEDEKEEPAPSSLSWEEDEDEGVDAHEDSESSSDSE